MHEPVRLETERLLLREAGPGDGAFLLELLTDPDWVRFIGRSSVCDVAGALVYVEQRLRPLYERGGVGLWVVQERGGAPVGLAGLVVREGLEHPDLGFAFLPVARGLGIADEAARAVLAHARGTLGLERVQAVTQPANTASIRLLERLGFEREGAVSLADGAEPLERFGLALGGAPGA